MYTILSDDDGINTQICELPPHLRCASHTLNLVATTDAEKALIKSSTYKTICRLAFSKASNLWNKYSRSTKAADIIRSIANCALIVPSDTRWNSYYNAISKIRKIPDSQLKEICSQLKAPQFTKPELDFLNEYLDVMKCLATALDLMQGEQNSFLGMLLPTIITIKIRLQTMKPKLKKKLIVQNLFLFKRNTNVLLPASTELDQYLSDPGTDLCILQKYPSLKKIFLRYNTAITSSAPVERLLSSGKLFYHHYEIS
uniref:HAT C-terminal dimerisation domain-containing protein n=1 Tax=Strigamia maritima TaxID=126957 RepID=T1IRW0_STRMM